MVVMMETDKELEIFNEFAVSNQKQQPPELKELVFGICVYIKDF